MGAAETARRFVVQRRVRSPVIVLFAPFVQLKLSKPLYALGVHSAVFCIPALIRRIVDPVLSQRIRNVVQHLRLFEYLRDLLFRVFFASVAHLICLPILQINLPLASLSCFSGTQRNNGFGEPANCGSVVGVGTLRGQHNPFRFHMVEQALRLFLEVGFGQCSLSCFSGTFRDVGEWTPSTYRKPLPTRLYSRGGAIWSLQSLRKNRAQADNRMRRLFRNRSVESMTRRREVGE